MPGNRENKPFRIGIVDDDPVMLRVLRVALKTSGFEVVEAMSGTEGLNMTRREVPDALLLDIMMPDIDGFEVCEKLKKNPETSDIPVLFVSAKTASEDINKGLSLGAKDYFTKPFDMEKLINKVKDVLAEENEESDLKKFEGLEEFEGLEGLEE